MSSICRLCASVKCPPSISDIFQQTSTNHLIIMKIYSVLQMQIREDDPLPNTVCMSCIGKLNIASNFIKCCLSTQMTLRKQLQKSSDEVMVTNLQKLEHLRTEFSKQNESISINNNDDNNIILIDDECDTEFNETEEAERIKITNPGKSQICIANEPNSTSDNPEIVNAKQDEFKNFKDVESQTNNEFENLKNAESQTNNEFENVKNAESQTNNEFENLKNAESQINDGFKNFKDAASQTNLNNCSLESQIKKFEFHYILNKNSPLTETETKMLDALKNFFMIEQQFFNKNTNATDLDDDRMIFIDENNEKQNHYSALNTNKANFGMSIIENCDTTIEFKRDVIIKNNITTLYSNKNDHNLNNNTQKNYYLNKNDEILQSNQIISISNEHFPSHNLCCDEHNNSDKMSLYCEADSSSQHCLETLNHPPILNSQLPNFYNFQPDYGTYFQPDYETYFQSNSTKLDEFILCQTRPKVHDLRRQPHCSRCLNHNIKIILKGHKRYCRFRSCKCSKCKLTLKRRVSTANDTARRRARKIHDEKIAEFRSLQQSRNDIQFSEELIDLVLHTQGGVYQNVENASYPEIF